MELGQGPAVASARGAPGRAGRAAAAGAAAAAFALLLAAATVRAGFGPVSLVDRQGRPFATLWNDEVRADDPCDRGFAYLVRKFLYDELQGELPAGTRVETTLDVGLQRAAAEALRRGLGPGTPDERGIEQPQGAVVVLEPFSGDVLALVSGRCGDTYNRAAVAFRQVGSALKPFIYALALEAGGTPATVVEDAPLEVRLPDGSIWSPRNPTGAYRGPVTLREALVHSLNAASVRVLQRVGVDRALELLGRLGFSRLDPTGRDRALGLVLGGVAGGVSPLEMARAYATLAAGGYLPDVRVARRVLGPDGQLWQEMGLRRRPVLDPVVAYLVTAMLQDVLVEGTAAGAAGVGVPAAGKTGTGEGDTDAWFVGYTPNMVAAVWIGDDWQRPLPIGELPYASLLAVRVWADFMNRARPAPRAFDPPRGVVQVRIDEATGLRVPDGCALPAGDVRLEAFRAGTEPRAVTPRCGQAEPAAAPPGP